MRDDKATPSAKGPGGARMHEEPPNRRERPADAPGSGTPDEPTVTASEKAVTRIDTEDEVAEASDESFPASDPPSFNPGTA